MVIKFQSIKPLSEFPLLEQYRGVFDIHDRAIVAYNHEIYSNYPLTDDLIVHEKTHHKQQDRYGLPVFLDKYLSDVQFRLDMEVEAYRNQLESIKDRNKRYKAKIDSAKSLSSSLYGNIITFDKAMDML